LIDSEMRDYLKSGLKSLLIITGLNVMRNGQEGYQPHECTNSET